MNNELETKLQWSKFKYYSSTYLEENTQSPDYPGLLIEISNLNLQYTNQNCCTFDRDVRLRRNEDGEDEGMKEGRKEGSKKEFLMFITYL